MRRDLWLAAAAILCVALFGIAFIAIFDARVQSGDIYPVYSSLRSDAGGTKAYYESIGQLERRQVARGFEPLAASRRRGVTIFVLGVPPQALVAGSSTYRRIAEVGNRLVIGMSVCGAEIDERARKQVPIGKVWDLSWDCVKRTGDRDSRTYAPDYHILTNIGRQWQVIASDPKGLPIAAERPAGTGSIVLVSDTYALTNEALLRSRNPKLLARLVGQNTHVLFDEHHLGVAESRGVVSLARQYRLHGFAAGLLLIAVLFIWRNASSFLPRIADPVADDEVSGRAASSGLTNLLGRAIPKSELMQVCAAEWRRSLGARASKEKVERVMAIVETARATNEPAAAYREIAQLLNERRR